MDRLRLLPRSSLHRVTAKHTPNIIHPVRSLPSNRAEYPQSARGDYSRRRPEKDPLAGCILPCGDAGFHGVSVVLSVTKRPDSMAWKLEQGFVLLFLCRFHNFARKSRVPIFICCFQILGTTSKFQHRLSRLQWVTSAGTVPALNSTFLITELHSA